MRHALLLMSLVVIAISGGCSKSPALDTGSSTSSIRAAEAVGAGAVPLASFHLQLAREAVARAEALAAKGDHDRAESLLQRAEVDAELAILLSREQTEKSEADAAMARVRQLQRENR